MTDRQYGARSEAGVYDFADHFMAKNQPRQYWPVPMYVTMNTCVGVIVNGFLIHRFYSM
jgi:hypothetical protein